MNERIVIVIDRDKIFTDKIFWLANSIFHINKDDNTCKIVKHRYIQEKKENTLYPIENLTDFILTDQYRKLE